MNGAMSFVLGILIGSVFGMLITLHNMDTLGEARLKYIECLQVGAPKDNCAKQYLLPKEPRT
jgi:hypothetical protein